MPLRTTALTLLFALGLSGCLQVELLGPIAGAQVEVRDLGSDQLIETLVSSSPASLRADLSPEALARLDDFAFLAFNGVIAPDRDQIDSNDYYLLIARGGSDLDADQNLVADGLPVGVSAPFHALMVGQDMQDPGSRISLLTEVVYQYLQPALDNLTAVDIRQQLDLLAQRLVEDINDDGQVTYRDLLLWSQLVDRDRLIADGTLLQELAAALHSGDSETDLRRLALDILESGAPRSGEMVYRFTQPIGNSFTCATCHALMEPAVNGFRRPGHPLGDATRRPTYKDGQLDNMLDAVNSCLDEWMNAPMWTESSPDWLALREWLDQHAAPGESSVVDVQIAEPPAQLGGGDSVQGQQLFNTSCAICHGREGVGSIQAPPVVGFGLDEGLIARRVRLSGRADSEVYSGLTGGVMPFWGANRLNDEELLNLVAYVSDGMETGGGQGGDGGNAGNRSCAADHPKVGQTAELITREHNVSGTATIVDNCTIEVTNFNFDGRGIAVQFYTGIGGNFFGEGTYTLGPNLIGPPFNNATVTLTLPDDVTLDDFDSISVWCIPIGVSFGDGIFR